MSAGSAGAHTFIAGSATVPISRSAPHRLRERSRAKAAAQPAPSTEVVPLRTANSDTYRTQGRYFKTVAYPYSINYRDGTGWSPIDNTLVSSSVQGFAYQNRANRYRLLLPGSLASPVRVELGNSWVQFGLTGAAGSVATSGTTATYANAVPGVKTAYRADFDEVKETVTLASAAASASFVYSLQTSPDLTARETAAGGIDFVGASGVAAFGFAPPSVRDAAGATTNAVSLKLVGSTVVLSVDASWLHAAGRRFPVTVDPSVVFFTSSNETAEADTYLASGSPTTSFSGGLTDNVGYDGSSAYRGLFAFDPENWFANVQVLNAQLTLDLVSGSSTASTEVDLHRMTRSWTSGATWNTSDGSNSWSSPGGDFDPSIAASTTVGSTPGWYSWDITTLVRGWQNGTVANTGGFALVQHGESTSQVLSFASSQAIDSSLRPHLVVLWQDWLGSKPWYTLLTQQLTDRTALHVNVANGNLMVEGNDLHIAGTGQDLSVDRWYNNLSGITGDLGNQWLMTTGRDVGLSVLSNGSVIYYGPTGAQELFLKNSDGSYTSPAGASSQTLTLNSTSGDYTLTFNASGDVWTFSGAGKLVSQKDKNGNTITFNFDPSNGALASITDTQGRQTTVTYDARGYISTITDPSNRAYQYQRAVGNDNLVSYTDPSNKTTQYQYTGYNLAQLTDPDGNVTSFTYDDINRVTSITRHTSDGTNPTWTFSYTWVYAVPDPRCPSRSVNLTVVTDPNNHQTVYCSDSQARVLKTIDPNGHPTSTSFTADNQPQNDTDALGKTTTYSYDSHNNLASVSSPTGATDRYGYAASGHPYYVSDYYDPQYTSGQSGHHWHYAYDENSSNTDGNLTSLTADGQQPVKFTYNANGTVATATDANNNVTSYGYDSAGNLTSITPPAPLGAVTITYDSLSRIKTIKDGNGETRSYTYDPLDRVKEIDYSSGPQLTFQYDADGNLTYTGDPSGTYGYTYDQLGRLTQEIGPIASLSYGYDPAGNLTSITDGSGTTTYTYDAANQLTGLTEPGASTPIQFQYNADGSRTQIAYPNGVTEVLQYDDAQRLTRIYAEKQLGSGNILTSFTYAYTAGSTDSALRRSVTYQYPGDTSATTVSYGYDGLDRLTSASGGGHTYAYGYGANGNMTSKTIDGTVTNYSYNGANELTGTGFSFDNNGSQTSDANVFSSATYNALAQMSSVTPTGGTAMAMTYAALGQSRRVKADGTAQVNDILGLNRDNTSPATYFTRDTGGQMLGERQSGTSYYFLQDGLGSIAAVTDSTGNTVDSYHYDPYGNTTCTAGSQPCSFYEPIRYAGGYDDANTTGGEQLYKFGERYYDPSLGRWTQIDPVDNPFDLQGWNQYKYAGDDPANLTDLSGTCILCSNPLGVVSTAKHVWRKAKCFASKHPGLVAVGGVAIIGGAALFTGGLAIGALGVVETGSAFADATAEYGLEESSHLVMAGGGIGAAVGVGAIYKARRGC
jgi:RHS repeat-associated protein